MAEYTKKTCHNCGLRDIQPNMTQIEIERATGRSQSGVSGRTWLGAFIGHKGSQRAIGRTIFNSSKRNYVSKRKVWVCGSCSGFGKRNRVNKPRGFFGKIGHGIVTLFTFIAVLFMVSLIGSAIVTFMEMLSNVSP